MIEQEKLNVVFDKIREQLKADGGDAEITEIDQESGTVYVKLKGACDGCPMAAITLSQGIEDVLKQHIEGVNKVLPAK